MSFRSTSTVAIAILMFSPVIVPLLAVTPTAAAVSPPGAPAFTNYPYASELIDPQLGVGWYSDAGEPSIGINWDTGNVMFQAGHATLRAVFDDSVSPAQISWSDVSSLWTNQNNIDPILHTDSEAGRTIAGGLDGACSVLAISEDDGQAWLPMGNACTETFDHESVVSGPWKDDIVPSDAVSDYAVYYCGQLSVVQCWRSLDGGVTFAGTVPVGCGPAIGPGGHGSLHVGPEGNVYLPFTFCDGVGVSVSRDNGLTWSGVPVPGTASTTRGFDADVATSSNGRVWVAIPQDDGWAYVSWSDDGGASWTPKKKIGDDLGLTTTTFHEMIAGDKDRAAVAFLGSTTDGVGYATGFSGVWNLYVSYTYDAGATWTTVKASDDIVQRGRICDEGTTCDSNRNLLDFMDAQVDQEGRVVVGYADGCVAACAAPGGTASQSQSSWVTIARQSAGRGLFAAFDDNGTSPLSVAAGGPYSGLAGGSIAILGAATGGVAPYSYTWSVTAKPATSLAGASSFGNTNAASTTFTPDVEGSYTLQLSVTDGAATVASATASLVALGDDVITCPNTAVLLAADADDDAVSPVGDASEVLCLRVSDDATEWDVFIDVKGMDTTATPLYYDFYFTADYAQGTPFLVSGTWDGSTAAASFVDPNTYLPIPGLTVAAEMVANTFHLTIKRADILSPSNGDSVSGVYVDVNHCGTGTTCSLEHTDYAPDSMDGAYTFGSSIGSGGGIPLPLCSVELAADAAGDAGVAAGADRRDLVRFGTSDTDTTWTFCFDVLDFTATPTGAAPASDTRYVAGWDAPYEAAGVSYSIRAVYAADGTFKSASALKGVAGSSAAALAQGVVVTAARDGNQVRLTVGKASVGAPADGEQATNIFSRTSDDSTGNGVIFDRAPNAGGASFTFGQKLSDVVPPSLVTGLAVVDPVTGDSLQVSWDPASDNTGVTSYLLNRSTVSGGPYATIATPAGTSFSDSGLTADTTYYYTVAAKDAAGNVGPTSAEVAGTPTVPPPDVTPPGLVTDLQVSGTESDRISLSWTSAVDPESGIAFYNVYRGGQFLGEAETVSFTDGGLQPETTYSYEVSAVNGQGLEGDRAGILATTLPLPPPDCGQAGFELLSDVDFDSTSGGKRADIVRVSIRETAQRLYFHIGVRDMTEAQDPMAFQIQWMVGDQAYSAIAQLTNEGAAPYGVYTGVAGAGLRVSEDIEVDVECHSLIMGVNWLDIGSPGDGTTLEGVTVNSQIDSTITQSAADIYDTTSAEDFLVGSSNLPPVVQPILDQLVAENQLLTFNVVASDAENDPLTYSLQGAPAGASMSGAQFRWTPSYAQAGTYTVTVVVSDGTASASTPVAITVTDVDRPATLTAPATVTLTEAGTGLSNLAASDPDGGAILMSLDGPAWASITHNGAGVGSISWAPPVGAKGTYAVTVTATAGPSVVSKTIAVTVLQKAGLTLALVTGADVPLSPNQAATLTARITNTGPSTDTFRFSAPPLAGWNVALPGDVTLAPGESQDVTVTLTAPAAGGDATSWLTARSLGNTNVVKSVNWHVYTPVTTVLAWEKETFAPTDEVRGTLTLTWKDGTPISGVTVTAEQWPSDGGATARPYLRSTTTAVTDSTGAAAFTFGSAPTSRLPGDHNVKLSWNAAGAKSLDVGYTVG